MYYKLPRVGTYIERVKRYRIVIIGCYLLAAVMLLALLRPELITSDEQCWLEGSKEYKKTQEKAYHTENIGYLRIETASFDEDIRQKLLALQVKIENLPGVEHVDSLFASTYIYEDTQTGESALVKALPLNELQADALRRHVTTFEGPYAHYVDPDFRRFDFYIYSLSPIDLSGVEIPFGYHYSEPGDVTPWLTYLLAALAVSAAVAALFRMVFGSYISAAAALLSIGMVMVLTFAGVRLVMGVDRIHVAMMLIVVCITLVDFLYFYMRWHVSHYKHSKETALQKMLNRNLMPAFWTSTITVIGVGSLFLVDSQMIKVLSLCLILASTLTYLLNLTLLPAILSFFEVKQPEICIGKYCILCADGEINFNRVHLKLFIAATVIVSFIGAYKLLFGAGEFFAEYVDNKRIAVRVPYTELDMAFIKSLQRLEADLKSAHTGVAEVHSVASELEQIHAANSRGEAMDEQYLLQALFFLELYDLEASLYDQGSAVVTVLLNDAERTGIVKWLEEYPRLTLYLTDIDTLLSSAKIDKKTVVGLSLAAALLIIGAVMGWVFRDPRMVLVGFIVNAVPIAWFGLFIEMMKIPLSIEVLIAMTVTVGLASDATVHFSYKYFRNRYAGRDVKPSLEGMLFYSGIPVVIGTMILAVVFAMLTFTDIPTLQLIGGYGALLMLASLLTDIFILPLLLMSIDTFGREVEKTA